MIEAYPLQWPQGYPRSKYQERARFRTSFGNARNLIIAEVKRLGGKNLIISTNIPVKKDGMPYATYGRLSDTGVAVYFQYEGNQVVFCCDKWTMIEDNMTAISKAIEAMRGIDRWGVSEMLKRAFTGFKALPEAASGPNWWDVLEISQYSNVLVIKDAYRKLSAIHHPDKPTGNAEKFIIVQKAYEQAMQSFK